MDKKNSKNKNFDLANPKVYNTFFKIFIPTLIAQLISGTFVIFDTFFVSKGFHSGKIFSGISDGISFSGDSYSSLGPAAISYAMPYTFFIIGIGLAIGAGIASVITKQIAKGEDEKNIKKSMNSYLPLSIYSGLALMIFLLIFAKFLVWFGSGFHQDYISGGFFDAKNGTWFNNPLMNKEWNSSEINDINGHILSQASWYLRIQALGAIPYIYMVGGVVMLRVQGKAEKATLFSSVGLVVNILFDFIFIIVLKMNVVGAAFATILGQYCTAFVYYWFFSRKSQIKTDKLEWGYSRKIFKEVFTNGTSIMMLQLLSGLVLIMFTFTIGISNNKENDLYIVTNLTAIYQGYNAIFIFFNLIIIGVAQSMKPIIDYNYHINNYSNVNKARIIGFSISTFFSLLVTLLIIFIPSIISMFYTVNGKTIDLITTATISSGTEQYYVYGLEIAKNVIRILFITFPIATFILMSGTYFQSINCTSYSTIILYGKVMILLPLLLIFGLVENNLITSDFYYSNNIINNINDPGVLINKKGIGMFLSLPVADLLIFLPLIYFYFDSEKKLREKTGSVKNKITE